MRSMRFGLAAFIACAALGLVACTQAPADGLSGAAVGGATEAAPGLEPTAETLPATETAPEAGGAVAALPTVETAPETGGAVEPAPEGAANLDAEGLVSLIEPLEAPPDAVPAGDSDSDAVPMGDAAGPGPDPTVTAGTNKLSTAIKDAYVAAHNRWRAKYSVTQNLAWDDGLGDLAQDWANQMAAAGRLGHRPKDYYTFGENVAVIDPRTADKPNFVVDLWGSEEMDWDKSCTGDFKQCCASGKVCGHFTAVVWSNTSKVGCGEALSPNGWSYHVCNYKAPGNYVTQRPYPPPTPVPPTPVVTPTTGNKQQALTYNKDIPDGQDSLSVQLPVETVGTIRAIGARALIYHPNIGELVVKLTHPDGTSATLHNRTGDNTTNLSTFFGRGVIVPYGARLVPSSELDKLIGKPMNGTWGFTVMDQVPGNAGKLQLGQLFFKYSVP